MTEIFDAIVIGAGHNGLVTAAYLAQAGLDVLILERRTQLGGAAASEQLFPDFMFDTGSPEAGLFRTKIINELKLEKHGLQFYQSEAAVFAPQPGGKSLTLWRDLARSKEEISRFSKKDAEIYPSYLAYTRTMVWMLDDTLEETPPDLSTVSAGELWPWLKIGWNLRRSNEPDMMEFIRILPMSVRDFLDEWFESQAVKGVLALPAISGGMPGPYSAGTVLMFLYQQLGGLNGGYRSSRLVQGGIGRLSEVIAEISRSHGATIRTDTEVDRILLDGERARGVVLDTGEAIGSQLVISSLDPRRTFFELVGGRHLMPDFMREIRNIRFQGTTAKVHLALAGLPSFIGLHDKSSLTGYVVLSPGLEYLERAYDDAKYGRLSSNPALEIRIPTLMDSDLAPEGCHVMSIKIQYAPYLVGNKGMGEEKRKLGDLVVGLLSQLAPDLPELILNRHVITAMDWERDYGLTEGNIHHGRMELDQLLFMRPVAGYAQYRTPFENLYLCGAGTHPGGGVTGAPGYNAAQKILARWK